MPVPSTVIKVTTSWLANILSKRAFSTLRIFPLSGKMAWKRRSRPCFAEPPAESPSTINSSDFSGSFSWQSANFPGRPSPSRTPLRRVMSRALRAASRARAASTIFPHKIFASCGRSCKYALKASATISSIGPRTSLETNLSLVWLENFGSGTFTDKIQVRPSRISSPEISTFAFLAISCSSIYLLMTRVIAARRPVKCVPPSRCGILLVKQSTCSLKLSFHCIDTSAVICPPRSDGRIPSA